MPRKKPPRPKPDMLIAKIEAVEQSYYISENAGHERPVGDEAILDIVGRIEQISPRLKQHLDRQIDISLVCERSFSRDERTPTTNNPFLMLVNLRKGGCSLMAYLPADAFWALPQMIATGATHVDVRFEPPHHGSATLLSLYFASAQRLADMP